MKKEFTKNDMLDFVGFCESHNVGILRTTTLGLLHKWLDIKEHEKTYEILTIAYNNTFTITKSETGGFDISGWGEISHEAIIRKFQDPNFGYRIHSIKKLETGEILSVGDSVFYLNNMIVSVRAFRISNGEMFVEVNDDDHVNTRPLADITTGFLFFDMLGNGIGVNDTYWNVTSDFCINKCIANNESKLTFNVNFKDKKSAERYVLMNKPITVNLNDIFKAIPPNTTTDYIVNLFKARQK